MSPDAIVIGAGFAGLSAATLLAERGWRVLVLEARPGLGGRATAFSDPHTGEKVDNGQHVLFGCYRESLRFLRRVGADSRVRVHQDLAIDVIDRAGRRSRLACPPLPAPLHLLAGVLEWDALTWRERLSILGVREPLRHARAGLRGRATGAAASPDETVFQWLVRNGQASRLIEIFWEPLALAALNQPIREAAALPFTRVLAAMFGDSRQDAAIVLPQVPLDEMYAEPARAFLESRGGMIRTGSTGRVVHAASGSPKVVVRDETLEARRVICAVPWFELPAVLADVAALAPVVNAAARTPPSPIVSVNLWFDRPIFDRPFVGLPGRTMQWVFEKRAAFGERASHVTLVSSGAETVVGQSNEQLTALALDEIAGALPAARAATLRHANVVREKRATFSLAPGLPPRPATRTPLPGLLLAGDWIDTGLPATIESAVMSGHWAAEAALAV